MLSTEALTEFVENQAGRASARRAERNSMVINVSLWELAREGGGSGDITVDCRSAFASRLAPTLDQYGLSG